MASGSDCERAAKEHRPGEFSDRVSDSGEGRWTIAATLDEAVPVPVLSEALYSDSARAAMPTSPQKSCPPCGTSSVGTRRGKVDRKESDYGHRKVGRDRRLRGDRRSRI